VCEAARDYGLLTRPIGDVLLLMPPLCVNVEELELMGEALWGGLIRELGSQG
jgi:adenosylmethionine-8-amino-7-oxononanoate aminotransferase